MTGVRPWLPKGAFSDDAVKAALAEPLGRWSRRWFVREAAAVAAVSRPLDGGFGSGRVVAGAVADAELPGTGKRRLLEAALDADLALLALGPDDHHVLDGLALRAVADLVAMLDDLLGAGRDDTVRLRLAIAIGDGDALVVTLPEHGLIPAMKARIGAVRRLDTVPRARAEALRPLPVTAQGVLGAAELSLDDVQELGIGDVVILDRPLSEPVELRVAATGRRIGQGKLGRNGARVAIQF